MSAAKSPAPKQRTAPAPARPSGPFERAAWITLIATLAVTPLAVTKFPWADQPLTYTPFAFPQTVALVAGLAVTLALWAVARIRGEAGQAFSKRLLPFAAFAGWAVVATVGAPEPMRALLGKSTSALSLLGIVAVTALLYLVAQLTDTGARMRGLTRAIVYSATVVATIAVVQQLFGADVFGLPQIEAWMVGRGFSTIGNPDHLGTFLVMPAILAAGLALAEADIRFRTAALACLGITVAALVGTLTRGAWVGVAAGSVVLLVLAWRALRGELARAGLLVAAVVLAVVALALLASDPVDLGSRFRAAPAQPALEEETAGAVDAVLSDRVSLWRTSADIALDRPLTGIGPASFELGWYPNARGTLSVNGSIPIGDDPHSLPLLALATTGIPGLLALLAAIGVALAFGGSTSLALVKRGLTSEKGLLYVAWFAATTGLHVALLVAALSTSIVMYAFLGMAVLLRPGLKAVAEPGRATALLTAGTAVATAALLLAAPMPAVRAEMALAGTLSGGTALDAQARAKAAWWNMDVQRTYYHLRVSELEAILASRPDDATAQLDALVAELSEAEARQPLEYYYPSVRAQLLTRASGVLGPEGYAEAAIAAADNALAIMPAALPTRVNKAIALSDLGRYDEMADALSDHWELETSSPYPGILYAQALALSGSVDEAREVFDLLEARFPGDASVAEARQQTESSINP